ncbi:hypothetical protein ALC56_14220 [Trachymyrmex septentrionalis]|uniref:Uncharacterized protein n=1 Tax=Trachymyrmex septentrionalis TaxID=34720 RepID=A0A195ETY1_9HYME|nr:hypothetical protein ALC56_14220 [Trachymyrmex septentrionalis]
MAASCMRYNSHTEPQWPSKSSKGVERGGGGGGGGDGVSRRNAPSHTRTHTEGAACTYRVSFLVAGTKEEHRKEPWRKKDWRRRGEVSRPRRGVRVWAEQTGIEKEELIKIQIP